MDVFELTRAPIDIESITDNQERVGNFLYMYLSQLTAESGGHVEPRRFTIFAQWGGPLQVTLSTHMDTVPPYIASSEDEEFVWGRGGCDTKGSIAAVVEGLLESGERGFCLLFVVARSATAPGPIRLRATRAGRHTSSMG